MIKYGIEFDELNYPKWGKIKFKLSDKGKFLIIINPSITPGKMPEGIKGKVPKGTKVYDYDDDKECIMELSLDECVKIIDFAKNQNMAETVALTHQTYVTKYLNFAWGSENLCNINYRKVDDAGNECNKIYLPVPFDGLRKIIVILNSYINNYVMIKTFCLSEILSTNESKTFQDKKYTKNYSIQIENLVEDCDV